MLPLPAPVTTNSTDHSLKNNFTEMKKLRFLSAALLSASMVFLLTACPSATGEVGPIGPKGDKGDTGAQGPAGQNGNANVIQVTFNETFAPTSSKSFTLPSTITSDMLNSSAILVYVRTSNDPTLLYQIPGLISADDFRYILTPGTRLLQIRRAAGTYVSSITMTKVIIIPASNLINGRKAAIDYSNYEEVRKAYNLPD